MQRVNVSLTDSVVRIVGTDLVGPIGPPGQLGLSDAAEIAADPAFTSRFLSVFMPEFYGAEGDGVTDDTAAVQAAVDAANTAGGGDVVLRSRLGYLTSAAVRVKGRVRLLGTSQYTKIIATNAADDGLRIEAAGTGASDYGRWAVRNIEIAGTFRTGVVCAPFPSANTGGLFGSMDQVWVSGSGTDGFIFANVYYSNFSNLSTVGAVITNAMFKFLATINGVTFDNLVSGGMANHLHNFYIHSSEQPSGASALPQGHGLRLNNPVAQGGRYGIYIASARAVQIDNPYFENVANPVVCGTEQASVQARGVVINGGTYGSVFVANPYYANRGPVFNIACTHGMTVNAPEMFMPANAIECPVTGGAGTKALVYMLVNRDGTPAAYVVAHCGWGYSSDPTIAAPVPVSGVADTLTAVRTGTVLTGVTVTAGAAPVYATAAGFPAAVLFGSRCNRIRIVAPYHGIGGDGPPFHTFVARTSSATVEDGIEIVGDASVADGTSVTLRKAQTTTGLHAVEFSNAVGARIGYTRTLPVIAAP